MKDEQKMRDVEHVDALHLKPHVLNNKMVGVT